jgi:uncharacterized repeat protein (TIGR03803 family)
MYDSPKISFAALALAIVFVLTFVMAQAAPAQTFTVLHNFTGGQDGANPLAGLTIDAAGNLYGTTFSGGTGLGTVFKLKPAKSGWVFMPLYNFNGNNDGAGPHARVIRGPDGSLYGTTSAGGVGECFWSGDAGCGTVFNLRPLPNPWKLR